MPYYVFAIFALFSSVGNTIFNRISSHKISSVLSAAIKSFMILVACFFIALAFGHIKSLYSLSKEQWLWVGILGGITIVDWLFYFLALKRSHLEAFAPFEVSAILFVSNLLFSIFMISVVTSGATVLNIALFYSGLAILFVAMLYAVFNKKINPKAKLEWVLYSFVSATALAFTLLVVKLKLSEVPSDVVAFHQMTIVFVASAIMLVFSKNKKEIKTVSARTYFDFFISAIFNALLMVFRYKALASADANPSIVNIIVCMDFVFVSIATVLFFKEKNKKELTVLIILVVAGMILNALPAII